MERCKECHRLITQCICDIRFNTKTEEWEVQDEKKEFVEIFNNEDLKDWSIKIINSGGGLCCRKTKEIWLDEKYKDDLPLFLHEVAHAKTRQPHNGIWADEFIKLVRKYKLNFTL